MKDSTDFFYLHPDPEIVAEMIKQESEKGYFDDFRSVGPTVALCSGIFRQFPEKIPEWMEQLESMPEKTRHGLYIALWYSDTNEGRAYLQKALLESVNKDETNHLKSLVGIKAPKIVELPIDFPPSVLDMCWGLFMATGDEACVKRVIEVANFKEMTCGECDEDHECDLCVVFQQVRRVACWSLESLAFQHKRVLEICKAELAKNPSDKVLLYVVKSASERLSKRN